MPRNEGELERAAGSLLGLAAGDALGAGYEFHPSGPARAEMVGGGLGGWEPGEWTDDTQMAICIAEVTQAGPPDPHAVGNVSELGTGKARRTLAIKPRSLSVDPKAPKI